MYTIKSLKTGETLDKARSVNGLATKCAKHHRRHLFKGGDNFKVYDKEGNVIKLTMAGELPIEMFQA